MSESTARTTGRVGALAAVLALAGGSVGCSQHVTREEMDEALSDVRSRVEEQGERIDGNQEDIRGLREGQEELRKAIRQLRRDLDARVEELENRLVLSLPVHFEFDRAEIRPVDEPLLDRFAATVREHMPEGQITVEGFADPAGSDAYNRRLSRERARSVKEYLVQQGGLSAERVRAVGYGEDRLVNERRGPGRAGIANRRVTFVVEYSGAVGG